MIMDIKEKIRYIDLASTIISLIMITGIIYFVIDSDYQIFMNVRLIIFAIIFSIIGFLLSRKRLELFDKTL
jgi:hypothetical protein|tara:strand:- start:587 stop:799 length:213 start_codon:yes stop_codon:yes gene_type:complete